MKLEVILATAPGAKAMSELIDGPGTSAKLMVVGADFAPIEVTPLHLIGGTRTIQAWTTGTAIDARRGACHRMASSTRATI